MGNLLDFIYNSYIALRETVASLRASVERLDGQVGKLSKEVTGLREVKTELETRLDRLEKINDTLTTSTASLQQMIQDGGEDFNALIAEAKKGQGAFWGRVLELDKIRKNLQETSEAFEQLETKLRDSINNVLDYPDMKDFHERIEKLTPLFPGILATAGKTQITEKEADTLKTFITEIKNALNDLAAQDDKVTSILKETKLELQACLDEHCRHHHEESVEHNINAGGGAPTAH